jgi:hypothetical protein
MASAADDRKADETQAALFIALTSLLQIAASLEVPTSVSSWPDFYYDERREIRIEDRVPWNTIALKMELGLSVI